jgi:hypothetical protein
VTDVRAVARELHDYATHFEPRDWDWTRDHGDLSRIVYDNDRDRLRSRVRRALAYLFRRLRPWEKQFGVSRWRMFLHTLKRERHLPDGVLDNGGIIVYWEESGEYLQYVQPTVGALIANWMDAEPDNPHAIAVATEMARIQQRYADRIKGDLG